MSIGAVFYSLAELSLFGETSYCISSFIAQRSAELFLSSFDSLPLPLIITLLIILSILAVITAFAALCHIQNKRNHSKEPIQLEDILASECCPDIIHQLKRRHDTVLEQDMVLRRQLLLNNILSCHSEQYIDYLVESGKQIGLDLLAKRILIVYTDIECFKSSDLNYSNGSSIDQSNNDIQQIGTDLYGENFRVYSLVRGINALFVLLANDPNEEDTIKKAKHISGQLSQRLLVERKIGLAIYISEVHSTPRMLPIALRTVVLMAERKALQGNDHSVFSFDELKINGNDLLETGKLDYAYRLFETQLRSGELYAAAEMISQIVSEEFPDMDSVYITRLKLQFFKDYLIKTLAELKKHLDEPIYQLLDIDRLVTEAETPEQVITVTTQFLNKAAVTLHPRVTDHHTLAGQAVEYLKNNYRSNTISVASVAQVFDVQTSYLSMVFKQETGSGVLQYIHNLRIEAAKTLLSGSQMSVKEIAAEVGYLTPETMSKAFKRYLGITPQALRETSKSILHQPGGSQNSCDGLIE